MHRLIHLLSLTLGRTRWRRRCRIDAHPAKVNLGSGLIVAPGWINVDMGIYSPLRILPKPVLSYLYRFSGWTSIISEDRYVSALKTPRFIQHDMRYGLPFDNESVDFLFTSHAVDMMTQAEGEQLIKEAYRVLKAGGVIRICASDFDRNLELYRSSRKQEALERFFPSSRSPVTRRYCMYDFEMLASTLSAAGFVEIRRRKYQEGRVPDLPLLDRLDDYSLFVEAEKH